MTKKQKKQVDLVSKIIQSKIDLYNLTCAKGFELTIEEVIRYLEYKMIIKKM